MEISVVIPAYNEESYVGNCIKSILKYRTPEIVEIIVVDNASHDHTAQVAKEFPEVRVVSEPNKGTNFARQRGFIEAKGDYVAYLDADTRMPRPWIAIVKRSFAENPHLVALSGPFRYYDLPPFKKFLAETAWRMTAPLSYRIMGFAILGANFIVKKEALKKIGGFNTKLVFHGDDTDTARRLSKIGKVKFDMDFFILGSGRRLLEEGLMKTFWVYGMNFLWVATDHRPYKKEYTEVH